MANTHSDALVFFGATGDLAYKKIFPALQAMVKRGTLNVPVIGVAKAGWGLEQLKARAKDSLEKHGGLDAEAFEKASTAELKPHYNANTLAFMFETCYVLAPTTFALATPTLQPDYDACWKGFT